MSNICRSALPDLLLLLLLFSVVPCILSSARFNVTHIPGFDGELPFRLETGYVTLNEETGAELFYYFVESERNHSEDPLILWLLGGPGCSGVNGLAIDMGPIRFNVEHFDGKLPSTYANPYAWTKIANMLFVDWPVGTGFSYSENVNDYYNEDVNGTRLIHTFLKKWFLVHPSFLVNTFYMGGDSYGGKLAVLVAHEIVEANEGGDLPRINIKGYLVGNPATSENVDTSTEIVHAYGLGVVSKEFYQLVVTNCAGDNYKYPKNAICAKHLNIFEEFLAEINRYSILDPICDDNPASLKQNSMARSLKDSSAKHLSSASDSHTSCITSDLLGNYWANHDLVREALHVREGTVGRFIRCNFKINANFYIRSIPSSVPYHHSLMSRGYRALVYSGDHDLKIPFLGTLAWIKSLNYTVLEPWHSWKAGGQVAGYATLFSNNLTFTTIKGGSHVAPSKMPMQCFVMFERWSSHQAL
ncbi:Serine carboxypeptidase-like 18 [Apostasia shenzhenica]|uniref:Serine carboxypeptidase-like 18 n=1 Tax=Apostasia shenzhenica TaxID=1088818 RepID=A0A2I0A2A8_9ASPA|nr:Serine carboxypeptidase-like 18 [Apostasia shenzhenica]